MVILKAIGIWVVLLIVAIANGVAREALLSPRLSDMAAHQVSTLTGAVLILLVTVAFIPLLGVTSSAGLLGIGLLWLVLTVAFEFTFGHFVMGHSWKHLLADYNLLQGRVWVLMLAVIFLAPLLAARLRGL